MKNTPDDVAQCFQALLMLKSKKDEIVARRDEFFVVGRNIKWINELIDDLKNKEAVAPKGTITPPKK